MTVPSRGPRTLSLSLSLFSIVRHVSVPGTGRIAGFIPAASLKIEFGTARVPARTFHLRARRANLLAKLRPRDFIMRVTRGALGSHFPAANFRFFPGHNSVV